MSNKKRNVHHNRPAATVSRPSGPVDAGRKAFHAGNYGEAIRLWSQAGLESDPAVRAAIAEAHFRRALTARLPLADPIADLRRAAELLPTDGRLRYHLGLALHRAGRIEEARAAYTRAAELPPIHRGLPQMRALAELEADPTVPLNSFPWLPEPARAALEPVAALLRGDLQALLTPAPPRKTPGTPSQPELIASFWQALALLRNGDAPAARKALAPQKGLNLPAGVEPIRAFYHGLAAALAGNPQAAINIWKDSRLNAPQSGPSGPHPTPSAQPQAPQSHAIFIARFCAERVSTLQAEGEWEEAFAQAQSALVFAPNDPWLLQSVLVAANRLATAAQQAGQWAVAVERWETMRRILETHPEYGSLQPLLHNLAIAYEAQERWEEAAQSWGAVLNAMPKRRGRAAKKPANEAEAAAQEERIAWLRSRILDNYKRAGQPDQAIAYYKQAIKSDPENLDQRLELASALIANEQIIAARNEVQRILQKDPQYIPAILLEAHIHQEREEEHAAEQALRRVLAIAPNHDIARRGLGHQFAERGVNFFNYGQYRQARQSYLEALNYLPDDEQLLVFLGETEITLGEVEQGKARYEAAMATGKPGAYVRVFSTYAKEQNEAEARQIVQRAEAAGVASGAFYVDVGIASLTRTKQSLPSALIRRGSKPAKQTNWQEWGSELIEKGLAMSADREELLQHLIGELGPPHPEIAVRYARQLVEMRPDDPEDYMRLGLLQGINRDTVGARASFTKAERLARQQGRTDLLPPISEMRGAVGTPLFALLGPALLAGDPDMFDFDEEDL